MKILITGGAGYVGNALAKQLIKNDAIRSIHIYDNLSQGKHVLLQNNICSEKISFTKADILDNYSLKKALEHTDTLIHLATVKHPEHHYMEQVNHWGTSNIINLIENIKLKKFIFLSTADIYEETTKKINLNTVSNPKTPFAHSMLRAEKYVATLSQKCETAIVRAADIYGYNTSMHFNSGLNRHVFEAKYQNMLQLDADGLHQQSAIYINDLANLLAHIVLHPIKTKYYLASTTTWSGMESYEALKNFYPQLETTFTSHHLRLPDKIIQADAITKEIIGEHTNMSDAIEEITKKTNF